MIKIKNSIMMILKLVITIEFIKKNQEFKARGIISNLDMLKMKLIKEILT